LGRTSFLNTDSDALNFVDYTLNTLYIRALCIG